MQHVHILGIGGTFMSALALLAREAGYRVTGNDAHCYPPVSTLLHEKGIAWTEGYEDMTDMMMADTVIVGNAMKRGIPIVEAMLNAHRPYLSGPAWLAREILPRYRVLAVAGTHGKTTTTAMLMWILDQAGLKPSFLIGGVASNVGSNARLTQGRYFVIEADEYDTAFFDKQPKFMHYHPDVLILNNLEFDHADIYPNLAAIQQQCHYLLRTVPSEGHVIYLKGDDALQSVIAQGVYSHAHAFGTHPEAPWRVDLNDAMGRSFKVWHEGRCVAEVHWSLMGSFNAENALAAMLAADQVGVPLAESAKILSTFEPVKRRLEMKGTVRSVTVYDDFAHHPTAIQKTLHVLKQDPRYQRVLVVLECASYTMKSGVHHSKISWALEEADMVFMLKPPYDTLIPTFRYYEDVSALIAAVAQAAAPQDAILIMSNRGFEGVHERLLSAL